MCTYKKTDEGKLKLALNRILQKKKRRSEKITKLTQKIQDLESLPALPESQKIDLDRHHFELQQANADLEHLDHKLETIRATRKIRKGGEDEKENVSDVETEHRSEINADDAFLESLGMNPQAIDEQEVAFQNL